MGTAEKCEEAQRQIEAIMRALATAEISHSDSEVGEAPYARPRMAEKEARSAMTTESVVGGREGRPIDCCTRWGGAELHLDSTNGGQAASCSTHMTWLKELNGLPARLPAHQLTSSPAHRLTSSPACSPARLSAHQPTNSPARLPAQWPNS
ncbi:hypothetical protein EOD39_11070 [Acipenser ruthenus]|uniref:Uncharacterized protein n=1 Tax=Acipenser ruthenus TaxID=7906 RepID=A0A444UPY0_ACIRT|nr:hypothetical protein EOD39_11070 [Acipenser ruthenus]